MRTARSQTGWRAGMVGGASAVLLLLGGCASAPETVSPEPTLTSSETESPEPVAESDNESVEAAEQAEAPAAPPAAKPPAEFAVQPPSSEVVPEDVKAVATTLVVEPLPLALQSYSSNELFDAGGGGCGMSLWRAEGTFESDSILFSGVGEGPQLLIKLNGGFVALERMSGSGEEFYGQFAQQQFRNLAGDLEVTTEVTLGAEGEIESVAIDAGMVTVRQGDRSQEIAVKGDAGC